MSKILSRNNNRGPTRRVRRRNVTKIMDFYDMLIGMLPGELNDVTHEHQKWCNEMCVPNETFIQIVRVPSVSKDSSSIQIEFNRDRTYCVLRMSVNKTTEKTYSYVHQLLSDRMDQSNTLDQSTQYYMVRELERYIKEYNRVTTIVAEGDLHLLSV